ncbi:O-antigen ligase family protein [Qingshengfaniella alkalisoli]|uniref:O-antigen ligase family protein n=1 Tax=Qingshengfaniella alkalisoli TaxID=2599296 RepID=UPI001F0EB427|nr:O-antigen ligase family protein [Qingshengfaniella alkalisoli]
MIIAVVIAMRLSPKMFGRLLFVFFGIAMIASILFGEVRGDTGAWLGIYGSKNALAGAAATFIVIAASQILDGSAPYGYRLLAVFGGLIGCVLLLLAQSVSAMAVVPPAILIQLGLLLYYRMSSAERFVSVSGLTLLGLLLAILIATNFSALEALMLETTGKDATLTGRTDLWDVALRFIRERPFLGMGYQAFWVHGHAPAEALWAYFGIDGRSGFNFHNTYLSNAVEIGILGVGLQIFVLYGAAILTCVWAVTSHRAEAALMFVMVVIVIIISFVEVPIFFQFSLRSVLIICAFVYGVEGVRANGRWR